MVLFIPVPKHTWIIKFFILAPNLYFMEPHIGRLAFNIGMLLLVLCVFSLLMVRRGSAEYYIDLLSLGIIIFFLSLVVWDVRREAKMAVSDS